ncbi:hypothetical protein EIP91_010316 [Steccherinum ochraceum]|uniref:Uncharacterized protein n=1 Tax=Steccherinum ochraceum TaxID=92696 RepID=A0A4R0R2Z6_9APHY|nr:hypothetical protein EIP91_010316 [Steccherinum ochraceum]
MGHAVFDFKFSGLRLAYYPCQILVLVLASNDSCHSYREPTDTTKITPKPSSSSCLSTTSRTGTDTTATATASRFPASDEEAELYYHGLPSQPVLVARTGSIEYISRYILNCHFPRARRRTLRPAGPHKIAEVWEELGPVIVSILDRENVNWTSLDVVRIGFVDEPKVSAPVVLWIGVELESLSSDVGNDVALECKELLLAHGIGDVEVEIREATVETLGGPPLLYPDCYVDPIWAERAPFTFAHGIPICARRTPWVEGTGGFFLDEGDGSEKLYLVTTRHAVLPPADTEPGAFEHPSTPCDVLLLSNASFQNHMTVIEDNIRGLDRRIDSAVRAIQRPQGKEPMSQQEMASLYQDCRRKKCLNTFRQELSTQWMDEDSRRLGHIVYSPPFGDLAVIEIDASKIPSSFTGNVLALGDKYDYAQLAQMAHAKYEDFPFTQIVIDHLLSLQGTMTIEDMLDTSSDHGEPALMVVFKNGKTTGLTVGLAHNILSFTRSWGRSGVSISRGWAITSFDWKSTPFALAGDSGSVVVNGKGQIGGMITSGSGHEGACDLIYATPVSCILDTIRSYEPLANVRFTPGPFDDWMAC